MKLKRGLSLNDNFIKALGTLSSLNFPVKTSISIAKVIKVIQEEVKTSSEVRDKLMVKYGVKSISINGFEFSDKDKEKVFDEKEFAKEWKELYSEEFDIPLDEKIKLPKDDDTKISATDLMLLEDIVEY